MVGADRVGAHVSYARPVSDHEDAIEALRLAARPDRTAPAAMEPYLEKVRRDAYRVTDEDVDALRAAGFSEDEIFEQTVSAAVSEGLVRLDAALRALG
jgi:alkylhydroperoxidase family enzyme